MHSKMAKLQTNYLFDTNSNSNQVEKYYHWSPHIHENKTSADVLNYEFQKPMMFLKPELDRSNQLDDKESCDDLLDTYSIVLVPISEINLKRSSYRYIHKIDEITHTGFVAVVNFLDLQEQIESNFDDYKAVLRKKIESFKYLDNNWALEECTLPTPEAIQDGHQFIDMLPINTKPPILEVASDGEINYFWRFDKSIIDVGFYGDNMIHYFVQMENSKVICETEEFNSKALPRVLRNAIIAI